MEEGGRLSHEHKEEIQVIFRKFMDQLTYLIYDTKVLEEL